jgi:alkyl hydroperoxide reductase subunit F
MTYDLCIIGGGPAGVSAGVYAARKRLKTLFITKEWGGQSVVSADIQNWIGTPHISGMDFAASFKKHLEEYQGEFLEIVNGGYVTSLQKTNDGFAVTTAKNDRYEARTILIATGADRRRLTVPGADRLEHKGLTYCASCDGPLFSDMDVAVIGGGNAGFETAAQLLAYCKSVTLIDRAEAFKADAITVEKVVADPKMTAGNNIELLEILGTTMVEGIRVKDHAANGEESTIAVSGVFVEIGLIPNTGFLEGLVELDPIKRVIVDPKTQRTSVTGIWAAGDCIDALYHQNNIAAGDGVKALEDIYVYLKTQ